MEIYDEILCCTACGFCKKPYYSYNFTEKEIDFPKGKIMIAYGLLNGEIKEDMDVVKILQDCSLCKRCEEDCPSNIKIAEIINGTRYKLKNLLPEHKKIYENFHKYKNIFGEENFSYGNGKNAFFMGCLVKKEMKDVIISLLDKIGEDFKIISECCGYPLRKIGINFKKKNLDGYEKILFSCPNGMIEFMKHSPIHISQFFSKCDFKRDGKNYIYHDSEFLGRYLKIYEEPREIIKKIGNLIEFKENRKMARWCGGEIEYKLAFPEKAEELAKYIAKEAKEKNATIVTSSPHCYSHLKEYDAIDLVQLIEEKLKNF
ncbi:MAG: (Fe-S)-binding protein [Candidatus Thermoplasmatota archaeon]